MKWKPKVMRTFQQKHPKLYRWGRMLGYGATGAMTVMGGIYYGMEIENEKAKVFFFKKNI